MNWQPAVLVSLAILVFGAGGQSRIQGADKPKTAAKKPAAAKETPLPERLPLPNKLAFYAQVERVGEDGVIEIGPPKDDRRKLTSQPTGITKGTYLGLVMNPRGSSEFDGARILRVDVPEPKKSGKAKVQVAKSATGRIKTGEFLILCRPTGTTSAQLTELPEIADLEDRGTSPLDTPPETLMLRRSFRNLQQIGLALANFQESHNSFPPAALIGPDGKAWHSWRVLILPYVDAREIFDSYRFDEPWDGPNNVKLLSKIPEIYADTAFGKNEEYYTNYVAITGDGMAFSPKGAPFDGQKRPADFGRAGVQYQQITDGTSVTLTVGMVDFDRKIPWTKPEDIEVTDKLPKLGQKGSFALLPYKTSKGMVAPFLRADGWVYGIAENIDDKLLRSTFTISGGESFNWSSVPCIGTEDLPKSKDPDPSMAPVIYLSRDGETVKARIVFERLQKK
jgi:hypothetical protein